LTFIVRIFVNDTIAIAVWTSFHVCVHRSRAYLDEAAYVILQLASCKRSHLDHPR
jgi:hypothetical protein